MKSAEGRTERWIVVWFPPEHETKERVFTTEDAARDFAMNHSDVDGWNPLIVHRVTEITERMIQLG